MARQFRFRQRQSRRHLYGRCLQRREERAQIFHERLHPFWNHHALRITRKLGQRPRPRLHHNALSRWKTHLKLPLLWRVLTRITDYLFYIEKPPISSGFSYLSHKNIFPFYFYLSKIFYIFANQSLTSYFYCFYICIIFATCLYNSLIINTY